MDFLIVSTLSLFWYPYCPYCLGHLIVPDSLLSSGLLLYSNYSLSFVTYLLYTPYCLV